MEMQRGLRRTRRALLIAIFALAGVEAQAADQAPTPDASQTNPRDVPLSKKLDKNDGVLKPPGGVDREIHKLPPAQTGDKMPVIVPPGEPGGDQSVQPK
jgi:hypothetical protein